MLSRRPEAGGVLVKLIILVALVGMVLGGGLFAWSRMRGASAEAASAEGEHTEGETAEAEEPVPTQTFALGDFLVNLQSSDGTLRYLQTELTIVVEAPEEEEAAGGGGHGDGAAPEEAALPPADERYARDVAIAVLSSQSFEKLRAEPDRSQLKALLQQCIDEALEDYAVVDVLFTAFVMQ